MDVLTWQLPIVCGSWLILGLAAIYLLTNFSLPSLLGLAGLIIIGLVMLYAAIQRVEPYQELKDHPLMAEMRLPPETVKLMADRMHNWINRWLATGQYLIFDQDYRPSILLAITASFLSVTCAYFGSTTVIMMAHCLVFFLPTLWPHLVREWNHVKRLPWPPRMMRLRFQKQNVMMLSQEIIYEEDITDKEKRIMQKINSRRKSEVFREVSGSEAGRTHQHQRPVKQLKQTCTHSITSTLNQFFIF
ncbi:uncharacterized protein [Drosophila kikkawai]|uniref:Reticulon-like protein n=1 Tax=Drosophila kikkawai TaxID=30033 RepID=A0A6P4ICQ8_DROKI|nr:uncharacterized protein LOC108074136 [Drosophila kikkawai]